MTEGEASSDRYWVSFRRVGYALIVGALVGGLLSSIAVVGAAWLDPNVTAKHWWGWIGAVIFVVVFATPIFAIGIGILGAPVWYLLHRYHLRSWVYLTVLGATLTAATNFLGNAPPVMMRHVTLNGRIEWALVMGMVGAATGFIMWLIAYRRSN